MITILKFNLFKPLKYFVKNKIIDVKRNEYGKKLMSLK